MDFGPLSIKSLPMAINVPNEHSIVKYSNWILTDIWLTDEIKRSMFSLIKYPNIKWIMNKYKCHTST